MYKIMLSAEWNGTKFYESDFKKIVSEPHKV